jgi:hypothetical protein
MKKILFILSILLVSNFAKAQTGIGTTTPDASAKLEISSPNKGFLPPRVSLTATNSASPITSPANGLMVFNTVTAGTSPNQVVPGYYYWDATGLQWVSLSTTVGNVQNQGVFRSTSNTTGNTVVSSWNSRFNNIAAGDLTVTSNTSFALSNGIYKLEWALPYQQASTYNLMVLQEYRSSAWASFLSDNGYAAVGNGGNTDWGGGTFAADIVDCTSSTRTFRLFNLDGSRGLYYGASFIITKLNPAVTTSTTADNLGNHIATKNISLNGYYLSNDAGNEGIRVDNSGKIGVGTATPGTTLHIENSNNFGSDPAVTTSPSLYIYNTNNASTTAHATAAIRTNGSGGGNPYLSFDINGVRGYSMGIDNADADKFKFHTNWSLNNANTPVLTITSDGRVGMGTSSPEAGLHVASSVSQYVNVYGYLNQNQAQGAYVANTNVSYSIQTDGRIRAPEFNAISDVRIKKGISNLNSKKQLSDLNRLRVVNYSYIDQQANGNKNKTGFIAQEVEKVNSEFVNQSMDFIPSVFALAKSATLLNNLLQVTMDKPHDFKKGEIIKFFVGGKKEIIMTVESIDNPQAFSVKGWNESTNNLFIYGKKVTDFRAIDFDQITALSVAAIQELSKQIERLKIENADLKKTLSKKIENNQLELEKRLLKLEAKLNQ